jgi:hypothetical protein
MREKYRNKRTNGKHSKKEYEIGEVFKFTMKQGISHPEFGKILEIHEQHTIRIDINGVHICRYIVDYVVYYEHTTRYIDVKPTYKSVASMKAYKSTQAYRMFVIKKKLVEAIYGIEIEEL